MQPLGGQLFTGAPLTDNEDRPVHQRRPREVLLEGKKGVGLTEGLLDAGYFSNFIHFMVFFTILSQFLPLIMVSKSELSAQLFVIFIDTVLAR